MECGYGYQNQFPALNVDAGGGGGAGGVGVGLDRFPQWGAQETRDFLIIRAELDSAFMETKRNKSLWEMVSHRMREKGFNRSPDQCKCKWKNLVTRYKGCETMDPEGTRQQFPFYGEIQAIFGERMQRMLWMEAEGGGTGSTISRKKPAELSSDYEDEHYQESDGDQRESGKKMMMMTNKKKNKRMKGSTNQGGNGSTSAGNSDGVREIMEEFIKQQIQMEMQWMKAYEAREEERKVREMEWRKTMEALEKERVMIENRWREREEQRRVREEARAERRDALVSALINKIRNDDI